ncbi:MAG: protein phosphatase 2C domain-containing protein [Pseudomonadota bacterium]
MRLFYDIDRLGPERFDSDRFQFVVYTERADEKVRPNEDCAGWLNLGPDRSLFVLSDGLGGRPNADIASRTAVETILNSLQHKPAEDRIAGDIIAAIDEANEALMAHYTRCGATLAVASFSGTTVRPYLIGDSSFMLVGKRGLVKYRSTAHSPVGHLVAAGALTARQGIKHTQNHLVENVLGDSRFYVEVGSALEVANHDTMIMCSDGLTDHLTPDKIGEIACRDRLEDSALELANASKKRMQARQSADDLTFILIRLQPAIGD